MNTEIQFQDKFINQIKSIFSSALHSNFAISNKLKNNNQIKSAIDQYLIKYPVLETRAKLIQYICLNIELPYCKCGKLYSMTAYIRKRAYCSNKCKQKYFIPTAETIQKRKISYINTCLSKYNVTNVSKLESVMNKRKQTCNQRYGGNAPACDINVINKAKETCIKKYNVDNFAKSQLFKEKCKNTCIAKYNVQNTFQLEKARNINRDKILKQGYQTILKICKNYIIPLFTLEEYNGGGETNIYKWKCIKCGNQFQQKLYTTHFNDQFDCLPRCLKCYPKMNGFSKLEKELTDFCKQYFPNLKENNKQLIKPYQLDIVIDELKLAIQFNGIYWHSLESGIQKNYHLMKTEKCEEKGYRLIHIWQDDWNTNKEEIKNKLIDIFENKEIIDISKPLDRCWYSTLQFQKYKIAAPEIVKKGNYSIENCGYIIVKSSLFNYFNNKKNDFICSIIAFMLLFFILCLTVLCSLILVLIYCGLF